MEKLNAHVSVGSHEAEIATGKTASNVCVLTGLSVVSRVPICGLLLNHANWDFSIYRCILHREWPPLSLVPLGCFLFQRV